MKTRHYLAALLLFISLLSAAPPLAAQSLALDVFNGETFEEVQVPLGANSLLGFNSVGDPVRVTVSTGLSLSSNIITATGGGSGGGTWGSITGTLSAQTDLSTALAGKVSTSGSYADPAWLTSLAWSKITDAPSFIESENGGFQNLIGGGLKLSDGALYFEHTSASGTTQSSLSIGDPGTETDAATWLLPRGQSGTVLLDSSNLDAAKLTGTINDSRLSANVSKLGSSISLASEVTGTLPIASLQYSAITINGTAVSLGGSITVSGGGGSVDFPILLTQGGTGGESLGEARVNLGIDEVVEGIPQAVYLAVGESANSGWAGQYVDIHDGTEACRFWFTVDGFGSSPSAPSPGRLQVVAVADSDGPSTVETAILAAVAAQSSAFSASGSGTGSLTVTNVTAAAGSGNASSFGGVTLSVTTAGVDASTRLAAADASALTNVDAATVDGLDSTDFAEASHTHEYTEITDRAVAVVMTSDVTTTSTSAGNLMTVSVKAGKSYAFEATGLLGNSATTEGAAFFVTTPSTTAYNVTFTIPTNGNGGVLNGEAGSSGTEVQATTGPGASVRGRWTVSGSFTCSADGTLAIQGATETGGSASTTFKGGAVLFLTPLN